MIDNVLYYGDNLDVLREYIDDESVDLIYLDPPFNSNRSYNVLFREANGTAADSQITAFDDSWHWEHQAEETLHEIEGTCEPHVVEMMNAIVSFVGRNDVTAYLVMMTLRLVELHRVLKPTGSIYLHCDPTASHYLKVVMDTIFGKECFRSELIWKRSLSHGGSGNYNAVHDVLLYYAKGKESVWNGQHQPHDQSYIDSHYGTIDENGRRYQLVAATGAGAGPPRRFGDRVIAPSPGRHWAWTQDRIDELMAEGRIVFTRTGNPRYKRFLDDTPGKPVTDVWTDIYPVNSQAAERLGYPTQKPVALLERIIQVSSNEGDLVLDPFCGCGTTVAAAQKLGRQWIGIDITHLSIALMRQRLDDMFGEEVEYEVVGQPADVASAEALARQDRFQFEWWALSLIKARPANKKRRGADQGVDGVLYFRDTARGKPKKVVVQVKSGHVGSALVRDLCHVVDREKAVMGFFVSLENPSRPMLTEAGAEGYYHSPGWNRDYPKIQIRTIEQILNEEWFDFPQANVTLAQAERVEDEGKQGALFGDQ